METRPVSGGAIRRATNGTYATDRSSEKLSDTIQIGLSIFNGIVYLGNIRANQLGIAQHLFSSGLGQLSDWFKAGLLSSVSVQSNNRSSLPIGRIARIQQSLETLKNCLADNQQINIPRAHILSAQVGRSFGFLPNLLRIALISGSTQTFVVRDRKKWMSRLSQATSLS
jgi:hypothetical protein